MQPERIVLTQRLALGDVVAMTALVRDLALAHPGRFAVLPQTPCMTLWQNNPHVTRFADRKGARHLSADYGDGIKKSALAPIHFLKAYHEGFEKKTGVKVPLLYPWPDLHLSPEEEQPLVEGRYWVVVAGGKTDYTTKLWAYDRYQELVDALRKFGIPVVQAGSREKGGPGRPGAVHPKLQGVLDLVGKTGLRELLRLIRFADGVVCTITLAMHVAAAFHKPCVVTGAGREHWCWEAYAACNKGFGPDLKEKTRIDHRYLHTIGLLDCCKSAGCWKNKVTPQEKDERRSFCKYPVRLNNQTVPRCQDMIRTGHVLEAVMSYYKDGSIPPLGPEPVVFLPDGSPALRVQAAPPTPPSTPPPLPGPSPLDHEAVGGKFTVFVLLYGDYPDMHERCLNALIRTVPRERRELRVGSNALGVRSLALVERLLAQGDIHKHYRNPGNPGKYPAMRAMFWDPEVPISTRWVLWLDDDTMVDRRPDWLTLLARHIVEHPNFAMHGNKLWTRLRPGVPTQFLKSAAWYRGRPLASAQGVEAPNGDCVHFINGSFWALRVDALRAADVPDARLGNNAGDVTIGAQLWQHGYQIKAFGRHKELVNWSSVPRRGKNEDQNGRRPDLALKP